MVEPTTLNEDLIRLLPLDGESVSTVHSEHRGNNLFTVYVDGEYAVNTYSTWYLAEGVAQALREHYGLELIDDEVEGVIYLLHFSQPVAHAQHYIGWAIKGGLFKRLAQHEAANGASSPLIKALIEQGGHFDLARVWDGSRNRERSLKNQRNARKLCPICREEAA